MNAGLKAEALLQVLGWNIADWLRRVYVIGLPGNQRNSGLHPI
jgi:hypothetical protein